MPEPLTIAVLPVRELCDRLFSPQAWQRLESLGRVERNETSESKLSPADTLALTGDADVCITSWGSPRISEEIVRGSPHLRLICHGAGTVKPFVSDAVWARDIKVTSAAAAIAVSVAETTLAWIIIAAKRALIANQVTHAGGWKDMPFPPGDMLGQRVGIVGASHVGRKVIELLQPFDAEIICYDPYLSAKDAEALGVELVDLDELMSTSDIVSLHAPNTDETRHMINEDNISLMKNGAAIINTARGAVIDEEALVKELETERIWAFLDVTDPEPPAKDHAFRQLPNVVLTPHIAGSVGLGRQRIGDYLVEEVRRFAEGEPQRYQITKDMLPRIG